jgi:hypothetical protein
MHSNSNVLCSTVCCLILPSVPLSAFRRYLEHLTLPVLLEYCISSVHSVTWNEPSVTRKCVWCGTVRLRTSKARNKEYKNVKDEEYQVPRKSF